MSVPATPNDAFARYGLAMVYSKTGEVELIITFKGPRSQGAISNRETRDVADIFALTEPEYLEITYCDPNAGRRDYKSLPPAEVSR